MPKHPSPDAKIWWIRVPVAVGLRAKFEYVRSRFGMYDLPESVRYVITFLLYHKDPEELAQEMAADLGIILPPLLPLESNESENLPDEENNSDPISPKC